MFLKHSYLYSQSKLFLCTPWNFIQYFHLLFKTQLSEADKVTQEVFPVISLCSKDNRRALQLLSDIQESHQLFFSTALHSRQVLWKCICFYHSVPFQNTVLPQYRLTYTSFSSTLVYLDENMFCFHWSSSLCLLSTDFRKQQSNGSDLFTYLLATKN